MQNTETVYGTRQAWWLLRLRNGEAFAISDFPEERRWTHNDGVCQILEWHPPSVFSRVMDVDTTKTQGLKPLSGDTRVVLLDYDSEEITQVEFETLRAFGLPVIDSVNSQGMPELK